MPEPADKGESLLLKGGVVVNHDLAIVADVLIQNGVIRDIGSDLCVPDGTRIIDVTGKYILPGGVDLDCHLTVSCLEDPVADSYLSGSQNAILGGTTTIVNTVYTEPDASLVDAFEQFLESATGKFACDYGVSIRLSRFDPEISGQLKKLVKDDGVCLVQLQIGSGTRSNEPCLGATSDDNFYKALRFCREHGILPVVHAAAAPYFRNCITSDILSRYPEVGPELHYHSQPERGEVDTILRATSHAFHSGQVCPMIVSRIHSTEALLCFLQQRRNCRGLLFGQTTVGAIGAPFSAFQTRTSGEIEFTSSKDWSVAAGYVSEPPLRPDVGLGEKLLVQLTTNDHLMVGSGHCAVRTDVKAALGLRSSDKIPRSMCALGCRLPVLWHCGVENHGGLDPCTFVRAVSTDPARLANLYPRKGRIAVGSDADIVVWSKMDELKEEAYGLLLPHGVFNLFSGLKLRSRPQIVILRGIIMVEDGKIVDAENGCGEYTPLRPFGHFAFGRLEAIDRCLAEDKQSIQRESYECKSDSGKQEHGEDLERKESYFFRKEHFDNVPKVVLPPGQRQIHTSVKTAQPPGGASHSFW
ncbi:unnamed protein product [Dicrocoelium dendriticum]|nr:unnamed protein product [Dicrocoelium dendriticum]